MSPGLDREALYRLCVFHPELIEEFKLFQRTNVYVVAAALKMVLLSFNPLLEDCFFESTDLEEAIAKHKHHAVLHRVFLLLSNLSRAAETTKMDAINLATCMMPSMGSDADQTGSAAAASVAFVKRNQLGAQLIREFATFFPGDYERSSKVISPSESLRLSAEEWFDLCRHYSSLVAVKDGELILEAGAKNHNVFRIKSGVFELSFSNGTPCGEVGAGTMLGVFSTFDAASEQHVTARAKGECEVNLFRAEDLVKMEEVEPAKAARLYAHIAVEFSDVLTG